MLIPSRVELGVIAVVMMAVVAIAVVTIAVAMIREIMGEILEETVS